MRYGMVCNNCTAKECKDIDSVRIECPCCDGKGCDECEFGKVNVKGCPCQYIAPVADISGLADLFDKGVPPITGGALDQAFSFTQAIRFLRIEESRIRAELRGN